MTVETATLRLIRKKGKAVVSLVSETSYVSQNKNLVNLLSISLDKRENIYKN